MKTARTVICRCLVGLSVIVATVGCSNGFTLLSQATVGIGTRVAILQTCPKMEGGSDEAAVVSGATAALIPAVVDAGFSSFGTALEQAAGSNTENVSARTVDRFYSASRMGEQDSAPFEVHRNADNVCIVIAHGPVLDTASADGFVGVFFTDLVQGQLIESLGLRGNPYFYYEGHLVYSADGSAFRINTAVVKYEKTIEYGSTGVRDLAVDFYFATPSAALEGKVFAAAKVPLGGIETGTTVKVSDSEAYSTPWMPLPAIGENEKVALSEARLTTANLVETMSSLKRTYERIVKKPNKESLPVQGVKEFVAGIDQDVVDRALKKIDSDIVKVVKNIGRETLWLDDTVANLGDKLDQQRKGLKGADETQRAVNARIARLNAQNMVAKLREELKDLLEMKAEVSTLKSVERDLSSFEERLRKLAKQLAHFAPFTLTVAVTETREANPVIKFVADVFSRAKPGLVAAVKEEIDPKTKKELEDKEKATKAAREDEFYSLRKAAARAVIDVQSAEIELRLLKADVDELQRHNAEAKLRAAALEAEDACRKAERKSAQPPECAPYL